MPLDLDPRKTALVLIDLQEGILSNVLAPHDRATIVASAQRLAQSVKAGGGVVVPVGVDFEMDRSDWPQGIVDSPAPPPESHEALRAYLAFDPAVDAMGADFTVTKRNWGAFHGTGLDAALRRRGIDTIILGGVATNFGVEGTAREAHALNYSVVIAEDATTSMGEPLHRFAIEVVLPRIARIRSTDQIVEALTASAR